MNRTTSPAIRRSPRKPKAKKRRDYNKTLTRILRLLMMRMRKILLRIDRVIVLGGLGNEIQSSYFSIRQISTRKTILDYRIVQK